MIDISILDERWKRDINGLSKTVKKIVSSCFDIKNYEVSIVFTDDASIKELNKRYRNIDKPTNVLSFNYSNEYPIKNLLVGEIIVSYDTILRESQEQEINFFAHTKHMLVHGALHILGYKHDTDDEANEMESKEREILTQS